MEEEDSSIVYTPSSWETIYYGEYPQTEIKEDSQIYEDLKDADWVSDELILEDERFYKFEERYFKYQPISWRILEKEGDFALLFASFGLDCYPFNSSLQDVSWATSSIRNYLNDVFLNQAFIDKGTAILMTKSFSYKKKIYLVNMLI